MVVGNGGSQRQEARDLQPMEERTTLVGNSGKESSPNLPITTMVPVISTASSVVNSLPFITKGSVDITPERLPPPTNSSDIYFSLLTAPVFHNLRFSPQYLTWLQIVDPN